MIAEPVLITVITPFRDTAPYLDEAIASVLAQTERRFEYLLVDDGSRDDSHAIAERWAARDARLRVFRQPALGASAARNTGLDRARGKYVTFLDSDDRWRPEFLATLSAILEKSPGEMIGAFAWSQFLAPDGSLTNRVRKVSLERYGAYQMLLDICPPGNGSCLMFRSGAFADTRFDPSLVSAQDSEMWHRILCRDRRRYVRSVPRVLVEYRQARPGSLTVTQFASRIRTLQLINRRYVRRFSAAQRARITLRHATYAGYYGYVGVAVRLGLRAFAAQPFTILVSRLFWSSLRKFARQIVWRARKRLVGFIARLLAALSRRSPSSPEA